MAALLARSSARTVPMGSVELFAVASRVPAPGAQRRLLSEVRVDQVGGVLEPQRPRRPGRRRDLELVHPPRALPGCRRRGADLADHHVRIAFEKPDHRNVSAYWLSNGIANREPPENRAAFAGRRWAAGACVGVLTPWLSGDQVERGRDDEVDAEQ